jgi:hypothetical protein
MIYLKRLKSNRYNLNKKYIINIMATHPKNNEYVRKWRQLNREKYLEYDRKHLLKYYYYKKGIKELMNIDPTLFF